MAVVLGLFPLWQNHIVRFTISGLIYRVMAFLWVDRFVELGNRTWKFGKVVAVRKTFCLLLTMAIYMWRTLKIAEWEWNAKKWKSTDRL